MSRAGRRAALAALAVTAAATLAPATAQAAAPANDDFAAAAELPAAGGSAASDNEHASAEPGEPNHAGSVHDGAFHSVWWTWTATVDGPASVATCGSAFNTRVAVYTGAAVDALTQVAANEDSTGPGCPGTVFGEVAFDAVAGTTYRIAVDTSGGLTDSDHPRGVVELELTAPPGDDAVTTEDPFTFTMPRLKVSCRQVPRTAPDDCPRSSTRIRFRSLAAARAWVARMQTQGADIVLKERARPSTDADGEIADWLRERGRGGEVIYQTINPGERVTTTAADPAYLKLYYYEPAEDQRQRDAILAALEQNGEDRKNVRSRCEFIDTDASPDAIERRMGELLTSRYLTQERAGQILRQFRCGYEVTRYVEAPGLPVDVVTDVTGVDRKRDLIQLEVALPVAQDFLLVLREDPDAVGVADLALGSDGQLTAHPRQPSVLTVQVLERLTGRLVAGAEVSFLGADGLPETQRTDEAGEVTFRALVRHADNYAVVARVTRDHATSVGFRSLRAVPRSGAFVTMAGREMQPGAAGWSSSAADLARAQQLEVVPANLGTGMTGAPTSAAPVSQGTAVAPTDGGYLVGTHNVVAVPDDSSSVVGAARGLVLLGGGLPADAGGSDGGAFPASYAPVAATLSQLVTPLAEVFTGQRGAVGTVADRASAAEEAAVTATAQALAGLGVPAPSGLISDKGLGIISTGGGNIIATGGGNIIATGGLNLRDAQGNLIGHAGGNLIGQAGGNLIGQAGGNIIATGGLNLLPVYGGAPLIGHAGGN